MLNNGKNMDSILQTSTDFRLIPASAARKYKLGIRGKAQLHD
jgi:hypothetical protein